MNNSAYDARIIIRERVNEKVMRGSLEDLKYKLNKSINEQFTLLCKHMTKIRFVC